MILATSQDPFQPFDAKKSHPSMPEPGSYGAILFLLLFIAVLWRTKWRKR